MNIDSLMLIKIIFYTKKLGRSRQKKTNEITADHSSSKRVTVLSA